MPFTTSEEFHEHFMSTYNDESSKNKISHDQKINITAVNLSVILLDAHLPNFDNMSFEDVLEWREKLSDPLDNFRKEMSMYATKVRSTPWTRDFEDEIKTLVVGTINPAIDSLKKEAESYKYNRIPTLLKSTLSLKPLPIISSVFIGMPVEYALLFATGALALDSYIEAKKEEKIISNNGLSLLLK